MQYPFKCNQWKAIAVLYRFSFFHSSLHQNMHTLNENVLILNQTVFVLIHSTIYWTKEAWYCLGSSIYWPELSLYLSIRQYIERNFLYINPFVDILNQKSTVLLGFIKIFNRTVFILIYSSIYWTILVQYIDESKRYRAILVKYTDKWINKQWSNCYWSNYLI